MQMYIYYFRLANEVRTSSHEAYMVQQDLDRRKTPCWLSDVRKLLQESGFAYLYVNGHSNVPTHRNQLKQRLKDIFIQRFHSELQAIGRKENQGNKLRTYKTFKEIYERESYLIILNFEHHAAMCTFRINNQPLHLGLI